MLSVVLPTRNEKEGTELLVYCLVGVLEPVTAGRFELVLIDDSTDDSFAYLETRLLHQGPRVQLHHRAVGRGLATAIAEGIERASQPIVAVMDADFNHNPLDLPPLLAALSDHDFAFGSRFLPGGAMLGHPVRQGGSLLFNRFIRRALGLPTYDHLSGFWVAERERIRTLNRKWPLFFGYGDYFIRLLLAAHLLGWRIHERPVRYLQRLSGESKTRFHVELLRYTRTVLALRRERQAILARIG